MRAFLALTCLTSMMSLYSQALQPIKTMIDPNVVDWTKEIAKRPLDQKTIEWAREERRKKADECATAAHSNKEPQADALSKECKNCLFTNPFVPEDPQLVVFMSFSVPVESWLSLSVEVQKVNGVFLIRGLPQNSFQELSKKILHLKELGFDGTIQIDPLAFRANDIHNVPTFLVREGDQSDKVEGNISLSSALTLLSEKGETQIATKLKEKYSHAQFSDLGWVK